VAPKPRQIALAALDLVDADAGETLTMKRLTTRLNKDTSSLYNHIDGRIDLIERMRAIIIDNIDVSSFAERPWSDALGEWASSYLAAYATHPNRIRLMVINPITDPSTLRMYETVAAALTAAGWHDGNAAAVMRAVEAYVLGSVLGVIAPDPLLTAENIPPDRAFLRRSLAQGNAQRSSARFVFTLGLVALNEVLASRLDLQGVSPEFSLPVTLEAVTP
jgi:AcrR family transcriptional regulator